MTQRLFLYIFFLTSVLYIRVILQKSQREIEVSNFCHACMAAYLLYCTYLHYYMSIIIIHDYMSIIIIHDYMIIIIIHDYMSIIIIHDYMSIIIIYEYNYYT